MTDLKKEIENNKQDIKLYENKAPKIIEKGIPSKFLGDVSGCPALQKEQDLKKEIEKEIVETAKQLEIEVYMIRDFITNPRILKFREVALSSQRDDEIKFLEDLEEYDTLDGMARIKVDERLKELK